MTTPEDQVARLELLERQVARLNAEVAELRAAPSRAAGSAQSHPQPRPAPVADTTRIQDAASRLYRGASTSGGASSFASARTASISGDQIESLIGRYGTLLFAALAILMAVGVLVEVAVSRGLFTATVRVALGALTAVVVGGAGLHFRRRGEVRYGDVLLSIALAIVDLVAWGAGPRLHIVSSALALVVVEVVAVGIALLALHDENEFLYAVAVGGALSAPFVTSTGGGTALMLLSFGAVVIVSAMRAVRNPEWQRSFALLVGGALVYVLAAASLPVGPEWYAPYLVSVFAGVCALAALFTAPIDWRGDLARSLLATGLLGVAFAWDRGALSPLPTVVGVAVVLAAVTYAALRVREPAPRLWEGSALLLPMLSLGVAYPPMDAHGGGALSFAAWAGFALAACQFERRRGEPERGGAHLLAAGLLGNFAIVAWLWSSPLNMVAALGVWGMALSAVVGDEVSPLPLAGVAVALGGACLSAIDQLASRQAYAYAPFMTRSSASALCAVVALAVSAELIGKSDTMSTSETGLRRWADRPMRLGLVVGFAILWGRMELAHAFSRDYATFLLILYYGACGLATIIAGRWLGVQRLRLAGLAMAIYAAVKAMVEVAGIDSVGLRVGAYGAVGLFLLGAGYLYRVRREGMVAGVSTG